MSSSSLNYTCHECGNERSATDATDLERCRLRDDPAKIQCWSCYLRAKEKAVPKIRLRILSPGLAASGDAGTVLVHKEFSKFPRRALPAGLFGPGDGAPKKRFFKTIGSNEVWYVPQMYTEDQVSDLFAKLVAETGMTEFLEGKFKVRARNNDSTTNGNSYDATTANAYDTGGKGTADVDESQESDAIIPWSCHHRITEEAIRSSPSCIQLLKTWEDIFHVRVLEIRGNLYYCAEPDKAEDPDWKPFHHDSHIFSQEHGYKEDVTIGLSLTNGHKAAERDLALRPAPGGNTNNYSKMNNNPYSPYRKTKTENLFHLNLRQRGGDVFLFDSGMNDVLQHGIPQREEDSEGEDDNYESKSESNKSSGDRKDKPAIRISIIAWCSRLAWGEGEDSWL